MKKTLIGLFVLLSLLLFGCKDKANEQQTPQMGPMPVDVSKPIKRTITDWDEYTGRFEATDRVEIRARVTGYLTKQNFSDGQIVKAGDSLFVIDPRPFEYAEQRAQAQFNLTEKEYKRAQSLREQSAISQEELDRRFQEFQAAMAELNDAKLNVEYTQIRSPIAGRVSDAFVDNGNLVEANQTILTLIVSTNPIHFEFEASQGDLLKYLRLNPSGRQDGSTVDLNPLFIKLQDEDTFQHIGRVDFVDNTINPSTGAIKVRALVPNKANLLYPGLFGRARLTARGSYEALLIPQHVIQTDQNKKFVYVVNDQNQANRQYITVGSLLDNGFLPVKSGLSEQDNIVTAGIQRIRMPNQPVAPNVVDIPWQTTDTMPVDESIPSLDEIRQGKS